MAGIERCLFQEEANAIQEFDEFDPFKELQNNVICSSCKYTMDADCERDVIITHYASQWHRFNVKRVSQGKQSLAEEEYENTLENDDVSDSSDDEDERNNGYNFETGSLAIFTQNGCVYSIYRAILYEYEKQPSQEVFIRPLSCAIFLLAGGHFAGAIFENGKMTFHKTIKRYVIRAKQGKAQSASDSSGVASSAGSSLRRHNERRLKEEIGEIISEFKKGLSETPLVFIRCASYQKTTFYVPGILEKNDPRIRNIPFATKRPTLAELKTAWERLHTVYEHGTLEHFGESVDLLKKKQLARKNLQKKKKPVYIDIIEESEKVKKDAEDKKKDHLKIRQEELKEDLWPEVSRPTRAKLHEAVSGNDVEALKIILEENIDLSDQLFKYLNERTFAPNDFSFLHVAASNGLDDVLQNAKSAFLNLSEREKRAMAAEARLGVLSRCVNCGNSLPKVPFEYEDVKLCTPACVASHRARFNGGPKNL